MKRINAFSYVMSCDSCHDIMQTKLCDIVDGGVLKCHGRGEWSWGRGDEGGGEDADGGGENGGGGGENGGGREGWGRKWGGGGGGVERCWGGGDLFGYLDKELHLSDNDLHVRYLLQIEIMLDLFVSKYRSSLNKCKIFVRTVSCILNVFISMRSFL